MPPTSTASFAVYGTTISLDFEPKVIFSIPQSAIHSEIAFSVKINGEWITIYTNMSFDAFPAVSNKYTVKENADGTYTVPTMLTSSTPNSAAHIIAFA